MVGVGLPLDLELQHQRQLARELLLRLALWFKRHGSRGRQPLDPQSRLSHAAHVGHDLDRTARHLPYRQRPQHRPRSQLRVLHRQERGDLPPARGPQRVQRERRDRREHDGPNPKLRLPEQRLPVLQSVRCVLHAGGRTRLPVRSELRPTHGRGQLPDPPDVPGVHGCPLLIFRDY